MYQVSTIELMRRLEGLARAAIIRPYRVDGKGVPASSNDLYEVEEVPVTEADIYSTLGAPIFMPVKILAGRYQERNQQTGELNYVEYDEFMMPFSSVFQVEQANVIELTRVNGNPGTSKEWISADDFRINFRGLIVNTESELPPGDQIRALTQLGKVPAALAVECEYFEWLGFGSIVIQKVNTFQIEGYSHIVGYQMSCLSDQEVEARLRDGL